VRLRRTLIKPGDSRQLKRVIRGSPRLPNTRAYPIAGFLSNARPKKRSGFDGVSSYRVLVAVCCQNNSLLPKALDSCMKRCFVRPNQGNGFARSYHFHSITCVP
jgi:hypothetical protein